MAELKVGDRGTIIVFLIEFNDVVRIDNTHVCAIF